MVLYLLIFSYNFLISSKTPEYVAIVLLTLLPIGVASIKLIFFTQLASKSIMCLGNLSLFKYDFIAGYNDSRISVVLPLPDTPVIAINLFLGISISKV